MLPGIGYRAANLARGAWEGYGFGTVGSNIVFLVDQDALVVTGAGQLSAQGRDSLQLSQLTNLRHPGCCRGAARAGSACPVGLVVVAKLRAAAQHAVWEHGPHGGGDAHVGDLIDHLPSTRK